MIEVLTFLCGSRICIVVVGLVEGRGFSGRMSTDLDFMA